MQTETEGSKDFKKQAAAAATKTNIHASNVLLRHTLYQ